MVGAFVSQGIRMFNIRRAVETDWPRIHAMAEQFYMMTENAKTVPADYATMYDLFSMLQREGFIYVADMEGEAVAMLGCLVSPHMLNSNHLVATEIMWWVEPEHRRSTLAAELMNHAEAEAGERGCTLITMTKLAQSSEVVDRIYVRRGYRNAEAAYVKEL